MPILDEGGRPIHRRGVTAVPGRSCLGLPWLYRRGSALLGGVGEDAAHIADQVAALAAGRGRSAHAIPPGSARLLPVTKDDSGSTAQ